MHQNKKRIQMMQRDYEVLMFLWRWKVAPTKVIALKFFPDCIVSVAYNRLLQLKIQGFVRSQFLTDAGTNSVWALDRRGFLALRNRLPELRENGFASENIEHDFYVTAAHLGDWLIKKPDSVEVFSEQELRRHRLENYPSWVPKISDRRPDGYWRVPYQGVQITVALEVELNPKEGSRYRSLGRFYYSLPEIIRVLWIIGSKEMAKSLQAKFSGGDEVQGLKHNFIVLEDFLQLGWNAPIVLGLEAGRPLSFVLGIRNNSRSGSQPSHKNDPMLCQVQPPVQPQCAGMAGAFFDLRKKPTVIESSASSARDVFADSIAIRLSFPFSKQGFKKNTEATPTSKSLSPSTNNLTQEQPTNEP